MSIIETLVVFAGIPLAVVAVIYGLVFAGSARANDRRYRPGRPFDFSPVWFLSAPEQQASAANGHAPKPAVSGAPTTPVFPRAETVTSRGAARDGSDVVS